MKPKLLVVDDEPDFVQLIEYNLKRRGFDIFTAFNGTEALDKAKSVLPDAILLDLMLPDMDGVSVCDSLRTLPAMKEVPIVVVSVLDGVGPRTRSMQAGVACFFKKPVDWEVLGDCVLKLMKQTRKSTRAKTTRKGEL